METAAPSDSRSTRPSRATPSNMAWDSEMAVETGIEAPPGRRENGMYLAYLRDPDGNKICALSPPK